MLAVVAPPRVRCRAVVHVRKHLIIQESNFHDNLAPNVTAQLAFCAHRGALSAACVTLTDSGRHHDARRKRTLAPGTAVNTHTHIHTYTNTHTHTRTTHTHTDTHTRQNARGTHTYTHPHRVAKCMRHPLTHTHTHAHTHTHTHNTLTPNACGS